MAGDQESTASSKKDQDSYKALLGGVKSLFNNAKYSDLTITCGDKTWKAHQAVVCPRSAFLEKACNGNFKEASARTISLPDDDPDVVEAMLRCLYTAEYAEKTKDSDKSVKCEPLLFNVNVHSIADKYDIPALAKLAEAKFEKRAVSEWHTPGFLAAIKEMYTTAPDSKAKLHETAVEIAGEHAQELFKKDSGASFKEVLVALPKFASELCAGIVGVGFTSFVYYRCVRCGDKTVMKKIRDDEVFYRHCVSCGYKTDSVTWRKSIVK